MKKWVVSYIIALAVQLSLTAQTAPDTGRRPFLSGNVNCEDSKPLSVAVDLVCSNETAICHSAIKSLKSSLNSTSRGPIAQRLEQGTHNFQGGIFGV